MTKIKLALCQMNVIDDKKANIENARLMIEESISENADFIVLPEMFNCPYSNDKFIEYAEEEKDSFTLDKISQLAKDNQTYILAGSIPEKENGKLYINDGIGSVGFIARIGSGPEITVIKLKIKKNSL